MRDRLIIRDASGFAVKALICLIVWYTDVIQNRYIEIRNMLLILGALLVFLTYLDYSKYDRTQWIQFRPAVLNNYLIYLIGTLIIGAFASPSISAHIERGITIIEFYIIMTSLCYISVSRGDIDFFIWNYYIMYLFMCIVFALSPQVTQQDLTMRYSFGKGLNTNNFALYINIGVWCCLYLTTKKKIPVILCFASIALFIYSSLSTGSRKGLIAMIICFTLWYVFVYMKTESGSSRIWIKLLTTIGVSYLVYRFVIPYYTSSSVAGRMDMIFRDESSMERFRMYDYGWELIKNNPIIGYGFRGFEFMYGSTYSHSELIEVPVSSGIPLSIFYFSIYFRIGKMLFRSRIDKVENRHLQLNSMISLATILFIMLIFYSISVIHIYDLGSFMCFGIIISTCGVTRKAYYEALETR